VKANFALKVGYKLGSLKIYAKFVLEKLYKGVYDVLYKSILVFTKNIF